jgi:GNAT superfamily N-acetyltransferase
MKVEARHDISPGEIAAVEEGLYRFNVAASGHDDGQGLAFVARDAAGAIVGAAAGYSWGGICEIRQMWVDEAHRGQGLGRRLLEAAIVEAEARGCERVFLATYDFQAPDFYARFGFERLIEIEGWPKGHRNILMEKRLVTNGRRS